MARRRQSNEELLTRGIWWLPYLDRSGARLLCAIDSHGRKVCELRVFKRDDVKSIELMALRLLDQHDPPGTAA